MAKQIIPEELDQLIQEYLTDGVLTTKEREVILRKAEGMGLDRDEIDLYLDAQVQKIEQATDSVIRKQKGKTCPFCGAPVPQLADKCPECGQYITPEASQELQEILENLEDALVDFKSGNDFSRSKANTERYIRKAKTYYSNNPKIKPLLAEVEAEFEIAKEKAKSEAKKRTAIKILTNKWFFFVLLVILGPILSILMVFHYDGLEDEYLAQEMAVENEFVETYAADAGLNVNYDDVRLLESYYNRDIVEKLKEKYPKEYGECLQKSKQYEHKYYQCRHATENWAIASFFLCPATVLLGIFFLYIQFRKKD